MEPDLLGYLLNALDVDERRAVDDHLENNPESRRQLVALRRLLQPLEAEAQMEYEPSGDLFFRTLRAVAGLRGREQAQQAIPSVRIRSMPPGPARPLRWRRADVLVAACIALLVLLLVPPTVLRLRHEQEIVACADNLRLIHEAMQNYANDRGSLPVPDTDTPCNNAGIYVAKLRDAGFWTGAMQVSCPANNRTGHTPAVPPSLEDVLRQALDNPEEYERCVRQMGGCYAFNLGYEESGRYVPVNRALGDETPVMSDRPFRPSESAQWQMANSPNHAGRGQNVLFLGGNVRFITSRVVNDDDIFLNKDGRLAPGRGLRDAVLAPSETRARLDSGLRETD